MARKSNNLALNKIVDLTNSTLMDNQITKAVTFAVGTTGSLYGHPIATITGLCALQCFATCSTDVGIRHGATISVGTENSNAGLIAATSGTAIDAYEIWYADITPVASIAKTGTGFPVYITTGTGISYYVATETVASGVVTFYIRWSPISGDGLVTAV